MKRLILPLGALATLLAMAGSLLIAIQPDVALFAPLHAVSPTLGILIFALLLFGVIRIVHHILAAKKDGSLSRDGYVKTIHGFLDLIKRTLQTINTQSQVPWRSRLPSQLNLLMLTAASGYLLILIEWIFHVTKVSFMDSMNLGQKISVFLLSGLFLALLAIALNALLLLVEFLFRPIRLAWMAACINIMIPAALLTSLVILWVDSFTYTIFRFGILTSDDLSRTVYGILVCLLFLEFFRWLLRVQKISIIAPPKPSGFKWLRRTILVLFAVSSILAAAQYYPQSAQATPWGNSTTATQELPDIILLGGDGLSASNMSLYSYERQTTPNLNALAETSLLAENAFTNASKTYGSIISILTSKMPTSTRVIFPPDILHGADSDQHLPGMLKDLGYTTAQIGVSEYVDANTWNIHNAFDWVNQRALEGDVLVKTMQKMGYESPAYFIFTIEGRLVNRLLQALYFDTVENPFSTVADAPEWSGDSTRIDDLLDLLEDISAPVFVHVHLLESHGPKYEPAMRRFSVGEEQPDKWMADFYDDAILSYDAYVGEVIQALKASGRFDQTLLIIYSDHGMGFQTNPRIPLLIHFPGDQYAGRIQTSVQNLDIAPTILDYLEVPVPEWMEGESILQFSNQVREPFFAVRMNIGDEIEYPETTIAPFGTENHQFSVLQIFYCQRIYYLDLVANEWKIYSVKGYTARCPMNSLPDMEQVSQLAIEFLASHGYDTSIVP